MVHISWPRHCGGALLLGLVVGCGNEPNDPRPATGGTQPSSGGVPPGTGGTSTGGKATGGTATGGKATGGSNTGGTTTGGTSTGGRATGGTATGGKATGGTTSINCSGKALSGGTTYNSNQYGAVGNGYFYQLWYNSGSGTLTTYGVDANFKTTWNAPTSFLARVGINISNRTVNEMGAVTTDYAYTKTGSGGGYSFIGVYGWSLSPMVEYYIVDDWFGSRPNPGTVVGSFTVDDGTYDILTHRQINMPSVTGQNADFDQFFSLRQSPRQCGHISISEHWKHWASMGLSLGQLLEAKLLVEVGGGSGSVDYTTAIVKAQ